MTVVSHRNKYKLAIALVIASFIVAVVLFGQQGPVKIVQSDDNKSSALLAGDSVTQPRIAPAATGKPSSNTHPQSDSEKAIAASAWAAQTANEALKITQSSEANESRFNILLNMVRASCKVASFRASKLKNPRGQLEINQKQALADFLVNYCGDVSKLDSLITQRLGPNNSAFQPRQRDEETMLLLAAKPSNEVANALINEVLSAPDVDMARLTAPLISEMMKTGGPLESWQEFLPENPSFAELNTTFTIAGEIISCQQHRGCGANEILSMHECLLGRGCRPGEDLLNYRRRTTSPMFYQAAEQIALAMQARRYR